MELTEQELDLIKDVTQIAIGNAALSFSKLVKDDVIVKDFHVNPNPLYSLDKLPSATGRWYILGTHIVGQLQAATYLFVRPEDQDKICSVLLPASVMGQEEMREGILLEFDNIFSASLVTKYADLLHKEAYGDVPTIKKLDSDQINTLLSDQLLKMENPYTFRATIQTFHLGIIVKYIAVFDRTLVEAIRSIGQKSEQKDSLKGKMQGLFGKFFK